MGKSIVKIVVIQKARAVWGADPELQLGLLKKPGVHFPSGLVVQASPSKAGCAGSTPGPGVKIPHTSRAKNTQIKQNKDGHLLDGK